VQAVGLRFNSGQVGLRHNVVGSVAKRVKAVFLWQSCHDLGLTPTLIQPVVATLNKSLYDE